MCSELKCASWVNLTPLLDRCCRGEAEVRILNFETTWSELQRPSQTTLAEAKPRCVYSILKPQWSELQRPSQTAPTKAKPRCVYSIAKSHGQSSRYQVRILYRVSSPPQSRSKAVVCVSTPRMYQRSGYFLVYCSFNTTIALLIIVLLIFNPFDQINLVPCWLCQGILSSS